MAPIKAMKPHEAFGIAALTIGGCFVLWSSTFRTQLTCEFNRAEMSIIPIKEKHPSWALTALFGVGMIGIAGWQLKEMSEEESTGSSQHLLAHSNAAPFIPNQASSGLRTVMSELVLDSPNQAFTNQSEAVYTQLEPNSGWSEPVLDQISQQAQPQQDLISALAASPLSLVAAAPPGTGKTTLLLGLIGKTAEKYPDAQFLICGWKEDDFCGLGKVPGVLEVLDGVDFEPLMKQVKLTVEELKKRRSIPKGPQREILKKLPFRLVLDDFYATWQLLKSSAKFRPIFDDLKAYLGFIQTVGREFNVSVWRFTHSFNVEELGGDSNIRDALNLCGLGKVTKNEDGRNDGGFSAITKMLKNPLVVDDSELRDRLLNEELPELQKLSDLHGVPVFFTTMGHPPKLTLLPNMAWVENFRLPPEILQRLGDKVKALNPQTLSSQAFTALPEFTAPNFTQEKFPSLTEILETPQDKDFTDFDEDLQAVNHFPEMPEEAEKALFGVVWREMEIGKSKTAIITETLGCKGRNYQKGQQWYDHLLNKYKP